MLSVNEFTYTYIAIVSIFFYVALGVSVSESCILLNHLTVISACSSSTLLGMLSFLACLLEQKHYVLRYTQCKLMHKCCRLLFRHMEQRTTRGLESFYRGVF